MLDAYLQHSPIFKNSTGKYFSMFSNTIHSLSVEDVYNELDTSPGGLSSGDVLTRQVLYGKNQLHTTQSPSILRKFLIQVTHPFAILLWIASLLAF